MNVDAMALLANITRQEAIISALQETLATRDAHIRQLEAQAEEHATAETAPQTAGATAASASSNGHAD